MDENVNTIKVGHLKFANEIPLPTEGKTKDPNTYVPYGSTYNSYPMFLLDLYNTCGTHQTIVNGKTDFILGNGLVYDDNTALDLMVNPLDNIQELADKCVKDYIIFGYFCIEVQYSAIGEPIIYNHIPAQTVLTNKYKTKFWYNEDWKFHGRRNVVTYDRWTKGYTGVASTLFFFDGYTPTSNKVYTAPDYNAAIRSIKIDADIELFVENNINNHFSPSTIIDFFGGANVSDEEKDAILDELFKDFTGVKGQKITTSFNDPEKGKKTEVTNLNATDWADAFNAAAKNAQDRIFIGHGVTSPMLFGVKTEGQLGGATELETAFEIFKNGYINRKRKQLLNAFNLLFSNYKQVTGKLSFGEKPLFKPKIDVGLKEKVMTINEMRQEAGLPPIKDGDRFIDQPQPMVLQPVKPNTNPSQLTSDKKKDDDDLLSRFHSMADVLGFSCDEFEVIDEAQDKFSALQRLLFDVDSDISDYVIENDIKDLTLKELQKLIYDDISVKISIPDLKGVLNRLQKSGVVKVDYINGKVRVTPSNLSPLPDTGKVSVMYQYIKRADVEGADLLPTSRPFCKKLINNNRLYKRSEIQQMSALFGYSVFDYTGGWYYNPNTDTATPYCRHEWKTVKVKRKEE